MADQALLEKEGIVELQKDLRGLRRSEIKRYFGSSTSNRIILSKLIKSVIWQAYTRIQEGTEPPIKGNLRTFWYRWLKPAIAKVPKKYLGKSDLYDSMSQLFVEMVFELKLFRYEDFDFTDENWENRRIGTEMPEVLVFAEKRGWIRILREFHEEHGVSILALGGFPSALTSEYTTRDIKKKIGDQAVRLIGVVDYDPSGALIAESFRRQLEFAGLQVSELVTLIEPRHYSAAELELFRFPLPRRQETKTARWMEKTGGVEGKRYGLESESMPLERIQKLLKEAIEGQMIREQTISQLVEAWFRLRPGAVFSSRAAAERLKEEYPSLHLPSLRGRVSTLAQTGILKKEERQGTNSQGLPMKTFVYYYPK